MKFTASEFVKGTSSAQPDAYIVATIAYGAAIDCQGFDEALCVLNLGDLASASEVDVIFQDSPDSSTWTTITDAVFTQKTGSSGSSDMSNLMFVGRINLREAGRYVRCGYTVVGATSDFSVDMYLLGGELLPVTQTNTVDFSV